MDFQVAAFQEGHWRGGNGGGEAVVIDDLAVCFVDDSDSEEVAACALTVVATVWNNLANSLIGYAILLAGIPACLYWQRKNRGAA